MCVCIFMYESKGVRRRNGRSMQSMTHAKTGNISINILTVTLIIAILLHHLHNLSLTPVGAVFINWFYFNPITTDIIHFFLSSFPPPYSFPPFLLSFFRPTEQNMRRWVTLPRGSKCARNAIKTFRNWPNSDEPPLLLQDGWKDPTEKLRPP